MSVFQVVDVGPAFALATMASLQKYRLDLSAELHSGLVPYKYQAVIDTKWFRQ